MKTLLLNLFAGPGTGKSTTAAAIFSHLKFQGFLCELALEFAKDLVWEKSPHLLSNQIFVFGEQHHRITRLVGQVPIVVSDSPLLHSIIYDSGQNPHFTPMVLAEHRKHTNLNIFLERIKAYESAGRSQTEEQAREIDTKIKDLLERLDNESASDRFFVFPAKPESVPKIADMAVGMWKDLNGLSGEK